MARLFISHWSGNNAEAAALEAWLRANGWDDLFLDFTADAGIAPGERWRDALRQAADRCEGVICLISQGWIDSDWCQWEAQLAASLNKPLFPVIIERDVTSPPWLAKDWQHLDLAALGPTTPFEVTVPPGREQKTVHFHTDNLERLRRGLLKAGIDAVSFPWPPEHEPKRAPYRGLEPLEAQDAGIFFGRDGDIAGGLDLLRRLRTRGGGHLVVVLGASGAGKSSFLRAGLLPRLGRDDRNFLPLPIIRPRTAVLTSPETGLLHALETALEDAGIPQARATLRQHIAGGAGPILAHLEALQARRDALDPTDDGPPPTLVLPVDQAEELFSSEGDARAEAQTFLALLRDLLAADTSLLALLTIRSDSYRLLQNAPELTQASKEPLDLSPVPQGAYERIIKGPAERLDGPRALVINPVLSDLLLRDLAAVGGADPLPLLAFTLEQLYTEQGRATGRMEARDYLAMGGLEGALTRAVETAVQAAQHAGEIPKDRAQAEALLRATFIPWLAKLDPTTRAPLRRLARLSDLPEGARPLVNRLVEARLLVLGVEDDQPTVDIAHESLLRQWPLLAGWLEAESEALIMLDGVRQAAQDWDRARTEQALLVHRGSRLETAQHVLAREDLQAALGGTGRDYLTACAARDRAERRAARGRRRLAFGALTVFTLTVALAGFLVSIQARAVSLNTSRLFAQLAELANEQSDFGKGMLWALSGLPQTSELNPPSSPAASAQLQRASHDWRLTSNLSQHTRDVTSAVFSPDGGTVLTGSRDHTARLWDSASGQTLQVLEGHDGAVYSAVFSPDGRTVLTGSEDGTARLWDAASGKTLQVLQGDMVNVNSAVFSPDGGTVLTASEDGTARLWDAASGKTLQVLEGHDGAVVRAVFSPDGRTVLTGSWDNTARLWDAASGQTLQVLEGHTANVVSAVFSPDGWTVLTASGDLFGSDKTARLWDAASGKTLQVLEGHDGDVMSAVFSPDGSNVLTWFFVETARLWDTASGMTLQVLEGHDDDVWSAVFSPVGGTVLTGSRDHTARLWHSASGKTLQLLEGHDDYVTREKNSRNSKTHLSP
ncbi:MAG: TIR domain-containing protein, partial [Alphaproteobacteria bacterium]